MQLSIDFYHLSIFILGACFLGTSEVHDRLTRTKRIIGGVKAQPNEFPWYAFIRTKSSCAGGVLINSRWVLTAAHVLLIDRDPNSPRDINEMFITLGTRRRRQNTDRYNVSYIKFHELYHKGQPDNDIGLMNLAEEVNLKNSITPAFLAKTACHIQANTLVTLAGYGRTDNCDKNSKPVHLHKVDLDYIPGLDCKLNCYEYLAYDTLFCAGVIGNLKSGARGDSGGGLALKEEGYVIGITSCGLNNKPTIFVRVDKFHDWITENTDYSSICWIESP